MPANKTMNMISLNLKGSLLTDAKNLSVNSKQRQLFNSLKFGQFKNNQCTTNPRSQKKQNSEIQQEKKLTGVQIQN